MIQNIHFGYSKNLNTKQIFNWKVHNFSRTLATERQTISQTRTRFVRGLSCWSRCIQFKPIQLKHFKLQNISERLVFSKIIYYISKFVHAHYYAFCISFWMAFFVKKTHLCKYADSTYPLQQKSPFKVMTMRTLNESNYARLWACL